jgi:hypothetical protein
MTHLCRRWTRRNRFSSGDRFKLFFLLIVFIGNRFGFCWRDFSRFRRWLFCRYDPSFKSCFFDLRCKKENDAMITAFALTERKGRVRNTNVFYFFYLVTSNSNLFCLLRSLFLFCIACPGITDRVSDTKSVGELGTKGHDQFREKAPQPTIG